MEWLRYTRRRFASPLTLFVWAACVPVLTPALTPGYARAGDRPAITDARVYVAASRIVTDLQCRHLFSEQVVGTVESGLPAVVELAYRVRGKDGDDVRRGVHTFRLRYDVWDDVYSFERGDASAQYPDFAALRRAAERLHRVPIVAIGEVKPGGVYSVELSVAVHALRGGEEREIVGWVDDTVRGSSDGSWREQLLNVNGLIHRFFSRDRGPDNQSDWFETMLFTPASLPIERPGGAGGESP